MFSPQWPLARRVFAKAVVLAAGTGLGIGVASQVDAWRGQEAHSW